MNLPPAGATDQGTELARRALEKLLDRAESAWARAGQDSPPGAVRVVSLRLSKESFPEYLRLARHADKSQCNACLMLAERAGAITIEWDVRAGEHTQVERIVLRDADGLARHLEWVPRWDAIARAERIFAPFANQYRVLAQVIDCWKKGAMARGTRISDTTSWTDAIKVVDVCSAKTGDDIPIRRLSASLFGDSKRIEGLWPALDVLVHGELAGPPREAEDVFAELGLVKFPPTLLIAGDLTLVYDSRAVQAVRPYVGFAPSAITAVQIESAELILTVENLTTFHELAAQRPPGAIVVYTGGMPSPSWKRVYRILLAALPVRCALYHWGDIDTGGFRIAAHLAKCCGEAGLTLNLHSMVSSEVAADPVAQRVLSKADQGEIQRICSRWKWEEEAAALGSLAIEQEGLAITWPPSAIAEGGPE